MLRKGISPVIATVILVAIALVLAIALAGWVMGIWGTLGATEALQISGVINGTAGNGTIIVTIINKGNADANVTRVEYIDDGGTLRSVSVAISVRPGEIVTRNINVTTPPTTIPVSIGRAYVVKFYTAAGNVYDVPMRCERR